MTKFRLALLVLAGFVIASSVQPASAATITFTDRAVFDAAFPGATVQTFDGLANGAIIGTVDGVTYDPSGGDAIVTNAFLVTTSPNGLGSTSNGNFFGGTESITFSFSSPVSIFGIDINTFATANGSYTATTNLGEVVNSFFNPFPGFSTGQFLGFSTNLPFTSLTLTANGTAYTLDTLRTDLDAQAVPEPTSLLLLAPGLAAFVAARRLRSRRQV